VYCSVAALPPRLSGFSVSELDTLGLPLTTLNKQEVGRVKKHDLYIKLSKRQDEDEKLPGPFTAFCVTPIKAHAQLIL
jgi:hypothetical protein